MLSFGDIFKNFQKREICLLKIVMFVDVLISGYWTIGQMMAQEMYSVRS